MPPGASRRIIRARVNLGMRKGQCLLESARGPGSRPGHCYRIVIRQNMEGDCDSCLHSSWIFGYLHSLQQVVAKKSDFACWGRMMAMVLWLMYLSRIKEAEGYACIGNPDEVMHCHLIDTRTSRA
eukprot:scaffold105546_cov17-Prasinocladus_malaysianus.AAC.2